MARYSGTIAVHIDLETGTVARVVQLREEIHLTQDVPAIIRDGERIDCDVETA